MGLGKGLDQIFGEDLTRVLDEIQNDETSIKHEIKVTEIRANPYQPRVQFDKEKLNELAESIKEHGVFTPILVRKAINGYELIAGERRLRACKIAGLETIPAIILEMDDSQMMEVTMLENIQRENLNPIEEANGYYTLLTNLNYTQEQLAQRLGKSRTYITNLLRLRKLPTSVQEMVVEGKLSGSHVRTLLTLDDPEEITSWAKRIVNEQLSVHDLEKMLKDEKKEPAKPKKKEKDIFLMDLESSLKDKLKADVEVSKHKITISYKDNKDLNRILELLNCLEEEL
ncbi:MAG: ParB/RepB/Spo0J family partition protein [Erysipelotrichaceae bacterium]|nr:ParB/RepB/Spo0J family partition protein [Erysipelotrichaceae bacterium]